MASSSAAATKSCVPLLLASTRDSTPNYPPNFSNKTSKVAGSRIKRNFHIQAPHQFSPQQVINISANFFVAICFGPNP